MTTLIRVALAGAFLSVDPTCLAAHEARGWVTAEDQTPAPTDLDAPNPLDRDGDGAAGGSTAASDEEKAAKAALVEAIVALGGEKPHHATGLPRLEEIKADLAALAAALDAKQEAAGGLTLRELHADLTALGLEWTDTETPADLLAKRDAARAERAEKPAAE